MNEARALRSKSSAGHARILSIESGVRSRRGTGLLSAMPLWALAVLTETSAGWRQKVPSLRGLVICSTPLDWRQARSARRSVLK